MFEYDPISNPQVFYSRQQESAVTFSADSSQPETGSFESIYRYSGISDCLFCGLFQNGDSSIQSDGLVVGCAGHAPTQDISLNVRYNRDRLRAAAVDAIKGTPLEGSTVYVGGSAATYQDMQQGANYDLLIAGVASLLLILLIMVVLTRAIVAAAVIVGTVVLSLGASFGLAVLIWQHLIGIPLHWMVLPMAVIVLLAVVADYNLLLVSRMKEAIGSGLNTGIIRSMAGTGSVVTSAGLVFAFTMMSMAVSNLVVIGQVGTTIGLGLLFDTLVVRSLMTPSLAALFGKWFWWPMHVRQRPLPRPWPTPIPR